MKIILFTKKNLIISLVIFCMVIMLLFYFLTSHLITTSVSNDYISADLMSRIIDISDKNEKIAYLTFDDGPTTSVTPKVLDILKDENIKATFFVIGKSVESHPDIVKRAYEEGHYIANHGYDHNNSNLYKSAENFISEIKKTDLAIGKAIGVENYCSHLFRFPNGFMAPKYKSQKRKAVSLLSDINYSYIDWNCLNNDSVKKCSPSQLLANLKKSSKGKNILVILMHDTKDVSNSSLALEDSISYLKSQGYEFKNFYSLLP